LSNRRKISFLLTEKGFQTFFLLLCIFIFQNSRAGELDFILPADTTEEDTTEIELPFPFNDNSDQNFTDDHSSPLYLSDPSNIQGEFVYDPVTDTYVYKQTMGEIDYRSPDYLNMEEYLEYDMNKSGREFFREKAKEEDVGSGAAFRPKLYVESKAFDRIFGGNTIDIRPQGSAELSFGVNTTRRDNPAIPENQRRTTNFDFDEKIQLNVVGSIGDKLKISTSYNTEATFDFENQTKIEYTGYEDEIIQKIELGNVALPLSSSLIQGSQTLFGIKTELKFGRMRITSIFSQEKGERKEVNVQGGAQISKFEISASSYEDFQHYFLAHYFRDRYNEALSDLPNIVSAFRITKTEVWVTQSGGQIQNSRNVVAFSDLGERYAHQMNLDDLTLIKPSRIDIADNYRSNNLYNVVADSNDLSILSKNEKDEIRSYTGAVQVLTGKLKLVNGRDFEAYQGILLSSSEYHVNQNLGYISLNRKMNPEDILGVAYEYIVNDQTFRVGEMSNNVGTNQDAIYVKLLKSSFTTTEIPSWDLMMKNVYYLNSFGISRDDFRFEIWYLDPERGVDLPYIAVPPINDRLLLQVMELDNLDYYNAKHEDGEFDYIEGVTIRANKGRVYFPVLEPFGQHLRDVLVTQKSGDKYAFDELYSNLKQLAELDADKNRYTLKGSFKSSSSSEIRLNSFNIPQGSVVVTAGGVRLQENKDYTVDYNIGTVTILDQGLINSNTPIKVSLESNSLFNIQTKTLLGTRVDYDFAENLKVGGTVLNLSERPLTYKVNIGDEPINNTIVGVDGSYSTETPFLTKLVDLLPLYDTKEKSKINTNAEFAYLIPGNAAAIGKDGVAYIDDFEGSQSRIDMKSFFNWKLASTPRGQNDLFPEGDYAQDTLAYGYNRAKLSWYVIDPLFFNANDNRLPANITPEMRQNHYQRQVIQQEIFPNKSLDQTLIGTLPVLDLTYYPQERGQYNFDPAIGSPGISAGLENSGFLKSPETRWGGIMRDVTQVDFESNNIEFLQFWIMDPFITQDYEETFGLQQRAGGDLYFNFGEIAEDIVKDNRKTYENGFPFPGNDQPIDSTVWGFVPVNKSIVNAFDNLLEARPDQDIGYDGLRNDKEAFYHRKYMAGLSVLPQLTQQQIAVDPSADNFRYFRDQNDTRNENIVERYKNYNGVDGNSPVSTGDFAPSSTTLPDIEDVNRDNTLNTKEGYYQYRVPINKATFDIASIGQNYLTDVVVTEDRVSGRPVTWYQFKIPLRSPERTIGQITGFKSIRFMRMFLKGFETPVILRFAKLDLIRGEWRRYTEDLRDDGDYIQGEEEDTKFEINAVNVEENSSREPIHYVLPPGIEREINYGTSNLQQLNEQAMSMYVCDLNDGSARAAYRNLGIDIRQYKRLKMYFHVEDGSVESHQEDPLRYGDVSAIIRMGADFENNYYEYEVPLMPSPWGNHDRESVWQPINNVDVALDDFTAVKLNREAAGGDRSVVYSQTFDNRVIRIKGTPNISNVKVMMIGIKNPKQGSNSSPFEDGKPKCAIMWVNEVRVAEFDNSGGWATQGSITANLADLASVKLSGNMSTPGFGSLNQSLNERQQETKQAYDFSTNVELGKFTQDALTIPMYFRFSESWEKPRYVPLNPDIEVSDVKNSEVLSNSEKTAILNSSITYNNGRSLNFTNVKVNNPKGKSKQHIYDIQNFTFTYAYNLDKFRDVNTEYLNKTDHKGRINWAYSAKPKNYRPFNRSKWAKPKYLRLIKDFNFNLLPNQYSFSTSVDRGYQEKKLRQTTPFYNPTPYYQKSFDWDRTYGLQYNITRQLKFRFDATNKSFIEEPTGIVDKDDTSYTRWKETVWNSVSEGGTNLIYTQSFTFDYTIPINKIPIVDWVNLSTSYTGGYFWDRAAIGSEQFGNTIRNSSAWRSNSSLNLNLVYGKNDYLKRLANSERGREKGKILKSRKKEKNKSTKAESVKVAEAAGEKKTKKDEKKKEEKKKDKEDKYRKLNIIDYTAKILIGVKEISGSYTKSTGTQVPGYARTTNLLGFDPSWDAPGSAFILGQKMDTNYVITSAERGWLVNGFGQDNEIHNFRYTFQNTEGEQWSYRINIRPINNMRIELNGAYNYSIGTNMGYTWNDSIQDEFGNSTPYNNFIFDNAIQTGNFSVSTLTYKTAFVKDDRNSYNSATFDKFNEFRPQASQKLATERAINDPNYQQGQSGGYQNEYGPTQQDVMISSFLSAYRGDKEVNIKRVDFKSLIPLPNWQVTYDGIGKLKFFQKYFRSITLRHMYRSTYNIGTFTTNNLVTDTSGTVITNDLSTGNYIPEFQITTVSITEQFSPLIKVDFNWKNGLLMGFEYKRDRNISMSTVNNQITEVKGKEYVISLGYTFRNIRISFSQNSKANPKDIVTRMDISNRDNFTILRNIGEETNSQPGAGQNVFSIKFTADLAVSPKFNIRGFYDRIVTNPFISNSFPTASSNYGISLRFSLSQ